MSRLDLYHTDQSVDSSIVVLHPYFRIQWFRTLHTTPKYQDEAVEKAETLFRHVADSYFETEQVDSSRAKSANVQDSANAREAALLTEKSNVGRDWLKNVVEFDIPEVSKADVDNPRNIFEEELRWYLRYEGGRGKSEENPLDWWWVRSFMVKVLSQQSQLTYALDSRRIISDDHSHGEGLPCHPRYKCVCQTYLLKVTSHLCGLTQFAQRRHNFTGSFVECLDLGWLI